MRLEILLLAAGLAAGAAAAPAGRPLVFEENRGQVDDRVRFLARCPGYQLFLAQNEAVLGLPGATTPLRLSFVGAATHPAMVGLERLPGIVSYFIGDDPEKWVSGAPTFGSVETMDILPGINLVWRGAPGGELEFDFHVAPGTDPDVIEIQIDGACDAQLTDDGGLALLVAGGRVVIGAPRVFQEGEEVAAGLVLQQRADPSIWSFTFAIPGHDPDRPTVIDPVVSFSTYIGGEANDWTQAVEVDSAGDIYFAGVTSSLTFPTVSALQPTHGSPGLTDAFVCKMDSTGQTMLYSTYLGGTDTELLYTLAVDATGRAVVAGGTRSTDFAVVNPLQPTPGGDYDAFVTVLDAAGTSIVYSTYLGGTGFDAVAEVDVDSSGKVFPHGWTNSTDFPLVSPWQPVLAGDHDTFVSCLSASGTSLVYSTYLGGSLFEVPWGIAVDSSGALHVSGRTQSPDFPLLGPFQMWPGDAANGYAAKLSPAGAVVYSTYLGGSDFDNSSAVTVDPAGDSIHVGFTSSPDYPILGALQPALASPGSSDMFITRLSPSGSVVFSTYLGGSGHDRAYSVDTGAGGAIFIGGSTTSPDFPLADPLQPALASASSDATLTKLDRDGSRVLFSTYLGGTSIDECWSVAVAPSGSIVMAGHTWSLDWPVVAPMQAASGGAQDVFVASIDPVVHLRAIRVERDPVALGQNAVTVWMDVENTGANPVSIGSAVLRFRDPMGVDRSGDYTQGFAPGSPVPIAAGATEAIAFLVDVASWAQLGQVVIDGELVATDTVTAAVHPDHEADVPGSWEVVGALPYVRTIDATPTSVVRGGIGYAVTATVENIGMDSINVTSVALQFTGTVDRTVDYSVTPDPGNPTVIPAGQTLLFSFGVDVLLGAAQELVTIDAAFDGVIAGSARPVTDPDADLTDAWTVLGTAYVRVVDAAPTTVLQGSGGHAVSVSVDNVGDDPVNVGTVTLSFTGSVDRTPEYSVTPSPANPVSIAGLTVEFFDFVVDIAPGATLEAITLDAAFTGTDSITMAPVADAEADFTDTWTVVGCIATSCGDCNGDGVVSILDALAAALHGLGLITLTGVDFSNCNVTGALEPDLAAVVDVLDALALAQAAAGLTGTLSCC